MEDDEDREDDERPDDGPEVDFVRAGSGGVGRRARRTIGVGLLSFVLGQRSDLLPDAES